ncbi:MAG: cardiolipin synthase [Oscillospiraceae bacterium]|nr:cardiolipin synthase [Oscillospiraceae bacterium]
MLVLGIGVLSGYYRWFDTVMTILAWMAVVGIVSHRTDPGYKIAWIIPIMALPVFGILFYMMFGGNRLSRRLQRKMHAVEQIHRDNLSQDIGVLQREAAISPEAAMQSRYLAGVACCPVCDRTETAYYSCGEDAFGDMLQAIARAERYIFLEYFIIEEGRMWGRMLELLRKKAAAGVDVRVIYDDFGCITKLPAGYYKRLEAVGIQACAFNPYIPVLSSRLNNRDHRKFLIVDGEVGFTGGVNLADEYINAVQRFGYWKDCVIRLRGEAVWPMTVMFLSMWAHIRGWKDSVSAYKPPRPPRVSGLPHGFVQPFADSPLDSEDVGDTVFFNLITKARRSVYIMTPYLILSDKMISALTVAAKNGVDVRIVTPAIPDKRYVFAVTRAHYPDLITAGVRIYEFTPGFLHSKVFCVDGEYAVVGTVNFDFRSLYLHFEDAVWLYRADCLEQVAQDFEKTFPVCHRVSLAECKSRPLLHRLSGAFLRLFSPLM